MFYQITPYAQALEACMIAIEQQVVPMLHGHAGIGKSAMARILADRGNLILIDLRLSTLEPEFLTGYPRINPVTNRLEFIPPADFPLEGDTLPPGKNGWLLFFDEINTAHPAKITAAYKIILDRMIGQHKLHPQVYMMAAGNMANSKAIVVNMGSAMESRMTHIALDSNDLEGFISMAEKQDFDHRIISYVRFSGTQDTKKLNTFDPDNYIGGPFACQRAWEKLSKLIKSKQLTKALETLIVGTVGIAVGKEFIEYTKIYHTLPKIEEIMADPVNTVIPEDESCKYALTGLLASHLDSKNIVTISKYLDRFSVEFQTVAYQQACAKDKSLWSTQAITNWTIRNSLKLTP